MLTITEKQFYTELIRNDLPGLENLGKIYETEGTAAAEKCFADYVRANLPYDKFFSMPYAPDENEWRMKGEDDLVTGEKILALNIMSCKHAHQYEGGVVDWNLNPTYNGFPEWTYQVNRHHEWRLLGKLYRETGDERYTRCFESLCTSFIEQTYWPQKGTPEYEQGGGSTNTWRTIEVGIRMANNWPYAIFAFAKSPELSDHLIAIFFMSMWEQMQRLMFNKTGHNWLIMEMDGLIHSGILFRFYRDAEMWTKFALDCLTEQIEKQVYPDGFQFELTTNYHYVCIMNYGYVLELCKTMGVPVPDSILKTIHKMYHVMPKLLKPTGHLPDLNDGTRRRIEEWMATGLTYFPRDGLIRYFATGGKEGKAPTFNSVCLPYAGISVMRTGWDEKDIYMLFDGAHFGTAHQHEDKLSIILTAYGQDLIDDMGAFSYDGSPMRGYACSTYSHSTGIVDGGEQRRYGTHRWHEGDIKKKSNFRFKIKDDYEIAESAYEDGFGRDFTPVIHKRRVIFLKNGLGAIKAPFFVLADTFTAHDGQPHTCELLFNLQPVPYKLADNVVTSYNPCGVSLTVSSTGIGRIVIGESWQRYDGITSMMGWKPGIKPADKENQAYGHQPSPTAVFRGEGKVVRMVSVLSPACFDKPECVRILKEKDGLYVVSSEGAREKLDLKKYTF
ncbi:MAG: alginate lyase family protein [Clostridia bacterium]|nr:alginate lyase family protein [Clostridia bacterium]